MGVGIITFIKAIFVGATAAGYTGASIAAYTLAVNVARMAILAVIAKATAPKLDLTELARSKTITIRDPIAPQTFIYGEDLVSGPLLFANLSGSENRDMDLTVAFAGHEIDSAQAYRIDDEDIALTDLSGAEDGTIDTGKYAGVGRVDLRKGTSTQAAIAHLTSTYSSLFNAAHQGRGWSFMNWQFNLIEGSEDAFKTQPTNLRILARGYKIYDPRLDGSIPNGLGAHRVTDDTTWEWSHNPALCLAHFLINHKFGMKEETDRVNWQMVQTAADVCEELKAIPTAATQEQYTCNVTFSAAQRRREVRDELVNAMLGRLVFSQGVWMMWAGDVIVADVTLTEANLAGSITLQASTGSKERYNRVRGKYIDANKDYTAATYPEARSSTYVTQDGGEIITEVVDFMSTNNFYEAQRKSIAMLDMSRNQRVVVFEGNLSVFRVQPGATVDLDLAEWGFAGEKFFVTEWKFSDRGINLTLVEEDDTVWTAPVEGSYATRSATGVLTFSETGVPPVTSLAAVAIVGGVQISWTSPPESIFNHVEVWMAYENVRASATLVGTSAQSNFYDFTGEVNRLRYYWARVVNRFGEVSDYTPNLTTTTITAYPTTQQVPIVKDPFIRQGASFWGFFNSSTDDPTYVVGVGLNSTDVIAWLAADSHGILNGFETAARRGPDEWDVEALHGMSIEVRWRVRKSVKADAGSYSATMNCYVRTSEEDESQGQNYHVTSTEFAFDQDTDTAWKEFTGVVILDLEDTKTTKPRYIQLQVLGPSVSTQSDEFQVDFIDATVAGAAFAGADKSGFVLAPTSETGKYLKDDGTWDTPPGGGGGETNTGSNQGTDGVGVYDTKAGVDLQFRHVAPGSTKVTTTLNVKDIDVDIVEANIAHNSLSGYVAARHLDWTVTGAENIHANRFGAGINMSDTDLNRPVIEDYAVKHQTATVSANAVTVNLTLGNSVYIDMDPATADVALTLSNPPASARYGEVQLIIQMGTPAWGITWPGTITWQGGNAPELSTVNNLVDLVHLFTIDAGTTWYGTYSLAATLPAGGVTSFNTRTGAIVPVVGDYSAFYEAADATILKEANVQNSIQISTSNLQLVGDVASPGNSHYYGTNGAGTKGYYVMSSSYTLPLASASVRGGVKIGYTESGKNYPVELLSEQMFVNVPWTDTAYSHPSHPGDDISLDTTTLSGATVISDIDWNITTDTLGHVTNATLTTLSTREFGFNDLAAKASGTGNYVTTGYMQGASYRTLEVRSSNATQLVLNVGESVSYATGQTGEVLYVNSENGFQVNSSPDNWASLWAGRDTATICAAGGASTFPGNMTFSHATNNEIINAHMSDYSIEHQAKSGIATTAINYTLGQSVALTLTANITTMTISNWPATNRLGQLQIEIIQDSPPRTIAWPAAVEWAVGTAPDISVASARYMVHLSTRDAGTTIIGTYASDASSVDEYVNSVAFTSGTGVLTLGRAIGVDLTANLDGRYGLLGTYDHSAVLTAATVFDEIAVTDGVVTNISTRALTPANIGAAPTASPTFTGTAIMNGVAMRFNDNVELYLGTGSDFGMRFNATNAEFFSNIGSFDLLMTDVDLDMNDNDIIQPVLKDYAVESATNNISGTTATLTYANGPAFQCDMEAATGNVTITLSGGPPTGTYGEMIVEVTQDTTVRTITWAGGTFKWPGGTAPVVTATANAIDIFHFSTWDAGTTWYGSVIQDMK